MSPIQIAFVGEGAERNTSRAVSLFEEAAAKGALTAINGLGYVYFFGQGGMQKNEVRRLAQDRAHHFNCYGSRRFTGNLTVTHRRKRSIILWREPGQRATRTLCSTLVIA